MGGIALLIATWACGALGFALLAFGQKQHWALLNHNRADQPPDWLHPSGWSLLGIAALRLSGAMVSRLGSCCGA